MNQQMNEVWGMDWGGVESMSMDGPPVGQYTFQLVSAKRDVNKKGKPYVNVGCKVVVAQDETSRGKVHWEYLSLESHRLGFTKSFFENIGAGACLVPGKGPADAIGSVFEASVVTSTSADGTVYHNLRNITALDDEDYDEDEGEDEGEDEPEEVVEELKVVPPKKKRPKPVKSRVGGRR